MWVVASKTRVRHKRNRNISKPCWGRRGRGMGVVVAYHGPRPEAEAAAGEEAGPETEAVAGAALISNN